MTAIVEPSPNPPPNADPRETGRVFADPLFDQIGAVMRFIGATIVDLPRALRYPDEVLRQAARLILGSALVVWTLLIVDGVLVGQIGHYLLQQIGAQSYVGLFAAAGTLKGSAPIFFGFIVAAKIGCGFAAELGAMRINEEIDALEVMGISSQTYLVGTRVLAFIIVVPAMWLIGIGMCFYANYLTNVPILGSVSAGGYFSVFWAFTTPTDFALLALVWSAIPTILVTIIGCYFGMTAKGGPAGVGENTAISMAVNVSLITILGAGIMFQAFYGTGVVVPIAN
ncbi:MAG TPA: ABC transporter permease [Pseudonocardia sp.]|nr:ABC transporter permease [Pseudonocardia sp.]